MRRLRMSTNRLRPALCPTPTSKEMYTTLPVCVCVCIYNAPRTQD